MSWARWIYEPGTQLTLDVGGRALLTYQFRPEPGGKPFFHPLLTPQGVALTAFRPWDHPWHRGLWFAWKYVNGVNFWEEGLEPSNEGHVRLEGEESVQLSRQEGRVDADFTYTLPAGVVALHEHRTLVIGLPRPDNTYILDWQQTFTARVDVTLDRTPVEPASPWGGYAGLGWRAARTLGDFQLVDSEGRRDDAILGQRATWLDLSGRADGAPDQSAGIALFDHPVNPRHPTTWHLVRQPEFGYANASLVFHTPLELACGQELRLRYRVLIHDGWPDPERLDLEFRQFATSAEL